MILIPLRETQQASLESIMKEHIGGDEAYQELKSSVGNRCLIILEGLDEMPALNDPFFISLVKKGTSFEEATVMITSRPHACGKLVAHRTIEIVGFREKEIKIFTEKSFLNDPTAVNNFFNCLKENPLLYSLCYMPLSLSMLVDIFRCKEETPLSTFTELYQVFIVMLLQRHLTKNSDQLTPVVAVTSATEEAVSKVLPNVPKIAIKVVLSLSQLAFSGWFGNKDDEWVKEENPKLMFTEEDITKCGVEINSQFDGFGLLKAINIHDVPVDTITYSFFHYTVQEFLSAVYISTLQPQEQLHLFKRHYKDFSNTFAFYSGVTKLACIDVQKFLQSKILPSSNNDNSNNNYDSDSDNYDDGFDDDNISDGSNGCNDQDNIIKGNNEDDNNSDDNISNGSNDGNDDDNISNCSNDDNDNENNSNDNISGGSNNDTDDNNDDDNNDDVLAALLCLYESQQPVESPTPFLLNMSYNTLLPHECLSVCHILSCQQVSQLNMRGCHIGDKGAEILGNFYSKQTDTVLVHLDLCCNSLTADGLPHVMEVMKSESCIFNK